VLVAANSDQNALNDRQAVLNDDGKIDGITFEESEAERKRIENRLILGWGLAGAGAVALGVGAYLLAKAPAVSARVTLLPWANGRGMGMALRF